MVGKFSDFLGLHFCLHLKRLNRYSKYITSKNFRKRCYGGGVRGQLQHRQLILQPRCKIQIFSEGRERYFNFPQSEKNVHIGRGGLNVLYCLKGEGVEQVCKFS